ncbi:unnamed protein product [Nippostrongylus brasiliensis]|uniref:Kunitz/Bovine pancreatic trypsin inhibitor domain protein n=1 Tax=Nippostrongylus brasiliensis TaxID=27835 RepID=A0A0N4YJY4_NIPBR|nr:unnamed protein product [Nippostrongylus brasiliensis]
MLPLVLLFTALTVVIGQNFGQQYTQGGFYQQSPSYQYPGQYGQQQQQYGQIQAGGQMQLQQPVQQRFGQTNQQYQLTGQQYQMAGQQQQYQQSAQYPALQYQPTQTTTRYSTQASVGASTGVQYDSQQKDCTAPRVRGDFCNNGQQRQMFYYDSALKICQPFMYNGCNGNGNRFNTAAECKSYCIDGNGANRPQNDDTVSLQRQMKDACRADYAVDHLTPQQCGSGQQCPSGNLCQSGFCCPTANYLCNLRYDSGKFAVGGEKSDRYFYTSEYKTCMRFSFYGTLGNANNFHDYNSCMRMCGSQQ